MADIPASQHVVKRPQYPLEPSDGTDPVGTALKMIASLGNGIMDVVSPKMEPNDVNLPMEQGHQIDPRILEKLFGGSDWGSSPKPAPQKRSLGK